MQGAASHTLAEKLHTEVGVSPRAFCVSARGGAIIRKKHSEEAFKKLKGSVYSPCLPPSSERARTSMENYETLGTIGEGCATARTGELLLVASLAAA